MFVGDGKQETGREAHGEAGGSWAASSRRRDAREASQTPQGIAPSCTRQAERPAGAQEDVEGRSQGFRRAPRGPTLDEMKNALHAKIATDHPDWLQSDVQRKFNELGWTLIFTPPYCPKFQPIELFWQHTKGFVAREYVPGRNMKQLRDQVRTGWYGGTDADGNPHSPADCSSLVKHCLKHAQTVLNDDDLLDGKLGKGLKLTEKGAETDPNLIHNTLALDCRHEGTEDEAYNDSLFVEDDCDEDIDDDSDDESD